MRARRDNPPLLLVGAGGVPQREPAIRSVQSLTGSHVRQDIIVFLGGDPERKVDVVIVLRQSQLALLVGQYPVRVLGEQEVGLARLKRLHTPITVQFIK